MKCLVTGGRGFIGSHLVDRLTELGHEVSVFDLMKPEEGSPLYRPNATYFEKDISHSYLDAGKNINRLTAYQDCDWVFHLAALADVIPSIENPLDYHRVNVTGTAIVLDHCIRFGVKRFIFASSTSIYGIPKLYPTPETAPADPQYPYALTKYVAEQYVMHWGKVYHLPVVSLRITSAYGPRMKSRGYGSVFKVFLAQKANKAPYTVVGDGDQRRDYIFVSDVVDSFIKAAESDVRGEIFNVGYGKPTSLKRLIELMGNENGIVYLPKRVGEPDITWADIFKIKRILNWEPKVSFEDGIGVMLEHLGDWKNEPVWTKEKIEEATKEWFKCLGNAQ